MGEDAGDRKVLRLVVIASAEPDEVLEPDEASRGLVDPDVIPAEGLAAWYEPTYTTRCREATDDREPAADNHQWMMATSFVTARHGLSGPQTVSGRARRRRLPDPRSPEGR